MKSNNTYRSTSTKNQTTESEAAKVLRDANAHHRIDPDALNRFVHFLRTIQPSQIEAIVEKYRGVYAVDDQVMRRAEAHIRENCLTSITPSETVLRLLAELFVDFIQASEALAPVQTTRLFRVGAGEPFIQWLLTPIQIQLHKSVRKARVVESKGEIVSIPIRTSYIPERRVNLKDALFANRFDIGIFRTPRASSENIGNLQDGIQILQDSDFGDVAMLDLKRLRSLEKVDSNGDRSFHGYVALLEEAKHQLSKNHRGLAGIEIGDYRYVLLATKEKAKEITDGVGGSMGFKYLRTLDIATRLHHLHLCAGRPPITMAQLLNNQFPESRTGNENTFGSIVVETDNFVEAKAVARTGECVALVPDLALQEPDNLVGIRLVNSEPQRLVVYAKLAHLISNPIVFAYWYTCADLANKYLTDRKKHLKVIDLTNLSVGGNNL